jgi:tetratricopeptide (TPR) repeat protein
MCARYFRLAEKNENALQMVKVGEGLNLKTNSLTLEKALVLEALEDWDNGEKAYQDVLAIDADNYNALLFLMRKYNKDQKADEALSMSKIFEAKYSDNGREYLEKGKSLLVLKQTREAQTALLKAASLLPDNIEPRMLLGDSYLQSNEFSSALKQFSKVMELAPQNVDAHIKAARSCSLAGNPRAALEILKKISTKFYDNPVVQKEMGLAEFQTGDTASAKRDLNRFLQNGEPDLKAFVVLGRIYDGLGDYRQALKMFEKAQPLDENAALAKRRVEGEKAKLGGAVVKEESNPLAGSLQGINGAKGGGRFTLRVLTAAACIGGFAGGYLLNKQIADAQSAYNANQYPANMPTLRDDLQKKKGYVPVRNGLYGLGLLAAAGFSLTFVIK